MNAPLIDTWTLEAWVTFPKREESAAAEAAADATAAGKKATLNIVGFPLRHPSLQVSRTGHAYTHVRDVGGQDFSYEGSTYLFDGRWHHLAAVWDGARDEENDNTLLLYVDGKPERAAGPDDDESGPCALLCDRPCTLASRPPPPFYHIHATFSTPPPTQKRCSGRIQGGAHGSDLRE